MGTGEETKKTWLEKDWQCFAIKLLLVWPNKHTQKSNDPKKTLLEEFKQKTRNVYFILWIYLTLVSAKWLTLKKIDILKQI